MELNAVEEIIANVDVWLRLLIAMPFVAALMYGVFITRGDVQ